MQPEQAGPEGARRPGAGPGTVPLQDVLITSALDLRRPSRRDPDAEHRALTRIARSMSRGRPAVLAEICDIALTACAAGSSGVSVLHAATPHVFSWDQLAGHFAPYRGGTAPRHHSPCGVALDAGAVQLFAHPERHFSWMHAAGMPIAEGLVVPLFLAGAPFASIWVMRHEPAAGPGFTRTEADTMTLLGGHVCAAMQMTA